MLDDNSTVTCGDPSFTLSKSTFTCQDIGQNSVVLTVSDGNGNSESCTAIVTVISSNFCLDCSGAVNGTASIDECGICSGGDTGLTPNESCTDCEGMINGNAVMDACGVCDTNSNNDNETCIDCNGDINGTASIDECGVCSGGNTGIEACSPQQPDCHTLYITDSTFSETDNYDEIVLSEYGENYQMGDWSDLQDLNDVQCWLDCHGMEENEQFLITVNGNKTYSGTRKYYVFVSTDGAPFPGFAVHGNIDGKLWLGSWYNINMNLFVRCVSNCEEASTVCNVFECPNLEANIGDSCDDGNGNTLNDIITETCECAGTSIFDCETLQANIGDSCDDNNPQTENDTVTEDCECIGTPITYDCPDLSANFGDACDDGNENTFGDEITELCEC